MVRGEKHESNVVQPCFSQRTYPAFSGSSTSHQLFFFCEGNNLFSSFLPSPLHFSQDYQHDPYAEHNPCNTICCREDLNPSFPVPAGCYDSKVSYPISVSAECLLQPVCAPVRPVARFPALGQARPGLSLPSFHVVLVHGQIMRW